jgi:cyclopropane fatty-acyl-phospholipid synthase-like methyltransferase
LEGAGFEIKNVDVLGVHYSATIYRWYKNWVSNKEKVVEKYGERWYRIWVFFLAYSVITSRYALLQIDVTGTDFALQTRRGVGIPDYDAQELECVSPYSRST